MDTPRRRRAGHVPVRIEVDHRPDWDAVALQQQFQDGMITRSQLTDLGAGYADLQRLLRRRNLARVAPGIFVNHTGTPTWQQQAWAAVMHAWPAALSHDSVWRETRPIHVAIAPGRKLRPLPGSVLHRLSGLEERVNWVAGPPKVLIEHAVLDAAAAAASELAAIATLTSVVQRRQTTFELVRAALVERGRLRRGRWLAASLDDLATGTNSVLEHGYLVRVERSARSAHREPTGPLPSRRSASRAGRGLCRARAVRRARRPGLPRRCRGAGPGPRPRPGRCGRRARPHRAARVGAGLRPALSHRAADRHPAPAWRLDRCARHLPALRRSGEVVVSPRCVWCTRETRSSYAWVATRSSRSEASRSPVWPRRAALRPSTNT